MADKVSYFLLFISVAVSAICENPITDVCQKSKLKRFNLTQSVHILINDELYSILKTADEIEYNREEVVDVPYHVDISGYKHNWTDPEDGWTAKGREDVHQNLRIIRDQHIWVPQFTKVGYKKMKIPQNLYQYILENRLQSEMEDEMCPRILNCYRAFNFSALEISNKGEKVQNFTALLRKGNVKIMKWRNRTEADEQIDSHLRPILESWIGGQIPLDFSNSYGIRRYYKGASLKMHVDWLHSHVISAILQIDQKANEDWPLTFIDQKQRKKKISLKPGEMLLYESARLAHGKPDPFNGTFYDNIFVHYKPAVRWYPKNLNVHDKKSAALLSLEDLKIK